MGEITQTWHTLNCRNLTYIGDQTPGVCQHGELWLPRESERARDRALKWVRLRPATGNSLLSPGHYRNGTPGSATTLPHRRRNRQDLVWAASCAPPLTTPPVPHWRRQRHTLPQPHPPTLPANHFSQDAHLRPTGWREHNEWFLRN